MASSCTWTWDWPDTGAHLHVSIEAGAVLRGARQRWWESERGGQLFADVSRADGLWLALATPPHTNDRAGRHWLSLDPDRCRDEIERANAQGLRLIGYWHTHPQRVPALSEQDLRSFRQFMEIHRAQLPHPLAVLVGQVRQPNGIRVWSLRSDGYVEADYRVGTTSAEST